MYIATYYGDLFILILILVQTSMVPHRPRLWISVCILGVGFLSPSLSSALVDPESVLALAKLTT